MEGKRSILIEYLGIILLWVLMFGKNLFSHLLFVDYVPTSSGFLVKNLIANNFTSSISLVNIMREFFSAANLSSIFFSFAILTSMLTSYHFISKLIKDKRRFLFAFIFFFNPFVYTKIMIGQLGITIAYLLTPVFLFYLFEMFNKKFEYKSILKTTLIMTLIGAMTPHFFVINFMLFLIASFWLYFYKNKKIDWAKYAKVLGAFVLLLLLFNVYWIQGMFAGGKLSEIDGSHEDFFAPQMSNGISAISKVIGMWGFWRESAYDSAYNLMPTALWYVLIGLLVALAIVGYNSNPEDKKTKFFYSLFWIGMILGVGVSHPYTSKLFTFLFSNVPFFNGFRDSHKFVALIALAYAYLIPNAVVAIKNKIKKKDLKILPVLLVIALFVGLNFTMINLHGQVSDVKYPESYEEANQFFNSNELKGNIIALPWQGYLSYNWTKNVSSDGRIGAFVNGIIEKGVYTGPDEYGGNSGYRLEVSNCLNNESQVCLEEIGVEYAMYDKCAYYPNYYSWLRKADAVYENECVEVYYIGGEADPVKVPLRFTVSILISLIAILASIFYLLRGQNHKKL